MSLQFLFIFSGLRFFFYSILSFFAFPLHKLTQLIVNRNIIFFMFTSVQSLCWCCCLLCDSTKCNAVCHIENVACVTCRITTCYLAMWRDAVTRCQWSYSYRNIETIEMRSVIHCAPIDSVRWIRALRRRRRKLFFH